jgi:Tol biopolymer transport system component
MSLLLSFLICLLHFPGCSSEETTKPIPADTTSPGAILDLSVTTPPGRAVILAWHAPGDDGTAGQAAAYHLRYAADSLTEESWASATPLSAIPLPKPAGDMQSVRFEGLPYGIWHFAMKTCDEVPNWSPLSNIASANIGDFEPPGPVTNLMVSFTIAHSAMLSWTAPGNDGASGRAAEYDLRYSLTTISAETWDGATRVEDVPAPKDAGSSETFTVTGLEDGQTYSFALKTADESHNWSVLSNVASALVVDYMPPGQVTDLAVWALSAQGVTVGWTAPGNNGMLGRAVEYDLRYALTEIHEWTWEDAVRVQGLTTPDTAGATERFTIPGLQPGQTYYFALKTADEVPNWSYQSNLANGMVSTIPMRRLTNSPLLTQGASSPSWSPDGQSILFEGCWTTEWYTQIYVVPASGGVPVQLTNTEGLNITPSWSPDGQRFVFVSDRTTHNPMALWIMDAAPGGSPGLLLAENTNISECKWSPDGSQIAYRKYTTSPWASSIRVVPYGGGTPRTLTEGLTMCYSPTWSPDGTRVAFSCSDAGENADIWVKSVNGGGAVQLTSDPAYDGQPSWSPDGARILFASERSGGFALWVMSSIGENPVQLTPEVLGGFQPEWSPDGREIAVVIADDTGGVYRSDIWIIPVE